MSCYATVHQVRPQSKYYFMASYYMNWYHTTYIYIYIYIYIYVSVYVSLSVSISFTLSLSPYVYIYIYMYILYETLDPYIYCTHSKRMYHAVLDNPGFPPARPPANPKIRFAKRATRAHNDNNNTYIYIYMCIHIYIYIYIYIYISPVECAAGAAFRPARARLGPTDTAVAADGKKARAGLGSFASRDFGTCFRATFARMFCGELWRLSCSTVKWPTLLRRFVETTNPRKNCQTIVKILAREIPWERDSRPRRRQCAILSF